MLEEGHMTLGERYTCIILIDNDLLYGEWGGGGAKCFSFHKRAFARVN